MELRTRGVRLPEGFARPGRPCGARPPTAQAGGNTNETRRARAAHKAGNRKSYAYFHRPIPAVELRVPVEAVLLGQAPGPPPPPNERRPLQNPSGAGESICGAAPLVSPSAPAGRLRGWAIPNLALVTGKGARRYLLGPNPTLATRSCGLALFVS